LQAKRFPNAKFGGIYGEIKFYEKKSYRQTSTSIPISQW
ncbi:hypothetical protein LCGC14_2184450, partial [marine sediment metagenome]